MLLLKFVQPRVVKDAPLGAKQTLFRVERCVLHHSRGNKSNARATLLLGLRLRFFRRFGGGAAVLRGVFARRAYHLGAGVLVVGDAVAILVSRRRRSDFFGAAVLR